MIITGADRCLQDRNTGSLLETALRETVGERTERRLGVRFMSVRCKGTALEHPVNPLRSAAVHADGGPGRLCAADLVSTILGGFDAVLRFMTALYWPSLIIAVSMLVLCFRRADFGNLLPLWTLTGRQVLSALPDCLQLIPGVLLIFLYTPFYIGRAVSVSTALRAYDLGSAGVFLLLALNLVVVLSSFGAFEAATLRWPVVEAMRMQFDIRLDVIFLIPILIAVFGVFSLYTYGACTLLGPHVRGQHMPLYGVVLVICGTLAIIPSYFTELSRVYELSACSFVALLVAIWTMYCVVIRTSPHAKGPVGR